MTTFFSEDKIICPVCLMGFTLKVVLFQSFAKKNDKPIQ
jgi:uncharacterized protein (DUF2225 family)